MKIVIIQGELTHYRLPLFEGLGQNPDMDVTVVHGGERIYSGSAFKEVVLPARSAGPFRWLDGMAPYCRQSNVIIAMFDIRWPGIMWQSLIRPSHCVLWGHGFGRSSLGNRLRRYFASRAAAVLVYEDAGRNSMLAAGIDPSKVFVAGNTVAVPNAGRRQGTRHCFIFVGRLQQRKGIDTLIRAFAMVADSVPRPVRVCIIGSGPEEHALRRLAKELGVSDRISFAGAVHDPEELAVWFSQAIAYVSPGHVGLGVLHSAAYGVPAITMEGNHHAPEVENIIQGETGLLYNGDHRVLATILQRLANHPEEAATLGGNAAHRYTSCRTMPAMIERFSATIRQVGGCGKNDGPDAGTGR